MRKFLENFEKICKFLRNLTNVEKYIEILHYFWREFREMLKKLKLFL